MPPHPKVPHTFVVRHGGKPILMVRAASDAEARTWLLSEQIAIQKTTPSEAFSLGRNTDIPMHYAKPEYADPETLDQDDLFTTGDTQDPNHDKDDQ